MVTVHRKQNDTLPAIRLQCVDADGDPIVLTTATQLRFIVQDVTGRVVIDSLATADPDQTTYPGWWEYELQTGDLSTAGRFAFELEVTFPGGIQTFPTNSDGRLIVKGELG